MKHRLMAIVAALCFLPFYTQADTINNSLGMELIRIEPGSFSMGQDEGGDWDEKPVHKVNITKPFYIGATEVTNIQYEQFDPYHRRLRGKNGLSIANDEAVVFVSWHDAAAFCKWLSEKEGKTYRLPTEAEWEYVCRAGSSTQYHTGDILPDEYVKEPYKNQKRPTIVTDWYRFAAMMDIKVAKTGANGWGIYDMHGNVEEWCGDWYGPYVSFEQTDPVGYKEGDFRVVRGGSHSEKAYFLRSANRMSALPGDKHWLLGFRVVMAEAPKTEPLSNATNRPTWSQDVCQENYDWPNAPDPETPYFEGPICFVDIPPDSEGPMYSKHSHDPGLTWLANGDLMAVWYSTRQERGRELCVVASRFRKGAEKWDRAAPFWDAADRNDHTPAIWHDGEGKIYHFNGLSVGHGYRQNLALIMRISKDNGQTWSRARLINPDRDLASQAVTTVFRAQDGNIILPVDAPARNPDGATALWLSGDNGKTWKISKGSVRGVHGGVVQLKDGSLLGMGRLKPPVMIDPVEGKYMPFSLSKDMGETFTYYSSDLPPVNGGQRLVIKRLNEGPILLVSFTDFRPSNLKKLKREPEGMLVKDASGKERRVYGMYAALSFDEGKSWPVKKLITAGGPAREMDGLGNTGPFIMDDTHAEFAGYLAMTQTPDNVIHLITSGLHYRFNLEWLKRPMPAEKR